MQASVYLLSSEIDEEGLESVLGNVSFLGKKSDWHLLNLPCLRVELSRVCYHE